MATSTNRGASNKTGDLPMFKNTVIALGTALVLVTALGSTSYAQQNQQEWWRAYQDSKSGKHCAGGDESAASAYPSWMQCRNTR
jgi:hypothetical protein